MHDNYAALLSASGPDHPALVRTDRTLLVVGGDSAGGTQAAVLAAMSRAGVDRPARLRPRLLGRIKKKGKAVERRRRIAPRSAATATVTAPSHPCFVFTHCSCVDITLHTMPSSACDLQRQPCPGGQVKPMRTTVEQPWQTMIMRSTNDAAMFHFSNILQESQEWQALMAPF